MSRTAVLVTVPEAEPVVGARRLRHTWDAPLGMPPHVTLLFPFVPATRIAAAEEPLALLLAAQPAFEVTFGRAGRFPELVYLDPEPAEPFVRLTEAIAQRWPEHPPYEGAHDAVVPHLTVAEGGAALLDEVVAELEPLLPIHAQVREATLFVEDAAGRWHERRRLPLAQPGVE